MKAYFQDKSDQPIRDYTNTFQPKSKTKWTPKENHHSIETFIDVIKKDIDQEKILENVKTRNNLDRGERDALKYLSDRDDIMITKADKGGAVVILKTSDYIKEAQDQLSEKSNYRILPNDPTMKNNELVNKVIERFKKEKTLSDKTAENLKIKNPRTPRLYLLPKIHKEGNPGRPVISSIDCHTSNISRFIDHHLQPLV